MTEFYFVRHGKTEFNLEGRFQGCRKDSPLLEQSLKDAVKLGGYLKGTQFSAFYTSPMPRAQITGQKVLEGMGLNAAIQTVNDLAEFDFGFWDGDLVKDHIQSETYRIFMEEPEQFTADLMGGEDYYQFTQRLLAACRQIYTSHPYGKVLLFAHALVNTFAIKGMLGLGFSEIRQQGLVANTSLSVIKTNDFNHFELEMWNNTDFLQ
ncbi:probable phosphoglycerate mutase [Ligilactobacillus sp. WC1T17]|uniref:Probable phosphoglycerate mutase n=1 Tax=Ligilactobacillus ruminis TaxID=1623 RepID=A0ABY1ACZ3_9LACO|nr:probable phosphoglycerate mutase [Ligilactobacillus ruminis]